MGDFLHPPPVMVPMALTPVQILPKPTNQAQPEEPYLDETDDDLELEHVNAAHMKRKTMEMREKMKFIMAEMDEDQTRRYETFRRSGFSKAAMKRFAQNVLGQTVNANTVIVLTGIAKVFIGEVIEQSREVMLQWGEEGPLLPSHIREATRRLKKSTQPEFKRKGLL